jgi:uncharacterized protein (TIGR00369 family)
MTQQTIDWAAQQHAARATMNAGGGGPGISPLGQFDGKTGRQILLAMKSGQLPDPPMNDTMNIVLLEVGEGRVVFQGIPQPTHYNPLGTIHGGWFATLLDSALGCAVQTLLPSGRTYTTAGLNINIVRSATHLTGPLRAVAEVIHGGRQLATATASVSDEAGKLYAHATTTCFIFDIPSPTKISAGFAE